MHKSFHFDEVHFYLFFFCSLCFGVTVMKPSPDSRSWKFASFLIRAAKVLEMTSQLDLGYMPILKAVTGEGNRPF